MSREKKLEIHLDNLRICNERKDRDARQRGICLDEIAVLLCDIETDGDISDAVKRFRELTDARSLKDCLPICSALVRHPSFTNSVRHAVAVGHKEATPAGSHGRIAYMKNKYGDEAFEKFSSRINGAKASITASMTDACEAVIDGSCEFCILPIRNSLDGRLWGFYSMLDRYGLKICDVCSIDAIDEISSTDCALIGKSCPEPTKRHANGSGLVFEFSVLSEDGGFLPDVLSVAKSLGATALLIDSRPVEYDVQLYRYVFSFLIEQTGSLLLRALLFACYDSYTPIGLYAQN